MKAFRIVLIICMILLLAIAVPSGTAIGEIRTLPIDETGGPKPQEDSYISDTEYLDESLHVEITQGRMFDTAWLAAAVSIADASQLRTSVAGSYRHPSALFATTMAKRVNAVLAVNGDYFGYNTYGYSARQGTVFRRKAYGRYDVLLIDNNGDFRILPSATLDDCQAHEDTVVNAFNFGPGLVIDGEMITEFTDEQLDGKGAYKQAQRICIAQTGPLEYLIVYCEGPENEGSAGMTIAQFAELVYSFGNVQNAYNLDGGSSSTVAFHGEKINGLSSRKIRQVSDIIYFASACQPDQD